MKPLKCDLNCFRAVFRFRFIFLRLSTVPRSDFSGSHAAKKDHRLVLFCARAVQSFWWFSFMAYRNLGTSPKRLEIELTNTIRQHFCPFCIEHPFFIRFFSLMGIFSIIYFFYILWQFDDTRTRQRTWQGRKQFAPKRGHFKQFFAEEKKASYCSLARFCRREHKKSTARASRPWKILSSTCRQV